jgi:hypothetical protein
MIFVLIFFLKNQINLTELIGFRVNQSSQLFQKNQSKVEFFYTWPRPERGLVGSWVRLLRIQVIRLIYDKRSFKIDAYFVFN